MIRNEIHYLAHPGLDNPGKIFYAYFFAVPYVL